MYGFNSDGVYKDSLKVAKVTDYALASNCIIANPNNNNMAGEWFLRSPDRFFGVCFVSFDGDVTGVGNCLRDNCGVRPALEIDIQ